MQITKSEISYQSARCLIDGAPRIGENLFDRLIAGQRFGVRTVPIARWDFRPGGPQHSSKGSGGIKNNASFDLSPVRGKVPLARGRHSWLPYTDRLCNTGSLASFKAGSQPKVYTSLPARWSGLVGEAGVRLVTVAGLPTHHPDPPPVGIGPGQHYIPTQSTGRTSPNSNLLTIYFWEFRDAAIWALTSTQMPRVLRTRGRAPPLVQGPGK